MFNRRKNNLILIQGVTGDQSSSKIQTLFKSAQHFILKLQQDLKAGFEITDNELIINIKGIKAFIESEEDLFIINEIFNDLTYGFYSDNDFILIDIGLNIGISSLYFSQLKNIKKIYAFEPVGETYNKCLRNLELNLNPANIATYNYGLGDTDRSDKFVYSDTFKGSVGSIGLSDYKKNKSIGLKIVEVEIRDASTVIANIIKQNPGEKIIIKMDCEGGENDIIQNLKESKVLHEVEALVLEWHDLAFFNNLTVFSEFNCFFTKNSPSTGMLYACRKN